MPAILRKFLPKSFASIPIIRPYAFYDRVVGSGHRGQDGGSPPLQHYILLTVLVIKPVQPVHSDARCGYDYDVESYVVRGFHFFERYLLRMYCATPNRHNIAIQNR